MYQQLNLCLTKLEIETASSEIALYLVREVNHRESYKTAPHGRAGPTITTPGVSKPRLTHKGAYHMPRDWQTAEGKAEAAAEGEKRQRGNSDKS